MQAPSLSGTKQSDFFLKEAQHKHLLERQAKLVETSLGEWSRTTKKCVSPSLTRSPFALALSPSVPSSVRLRFTDYDSDLQL